MNDIGVVEGLDDVVDREAFIGTELRPFTIETVEEVLVEVITGIEVRPFRISSAVVDEVTDLEDDDTVDVVEPVCSVVTGIVPSPGTMTGRSLVWIDVDTDVDTFLCCCAGSGPSRVVYPAIGPVNVAEAVTKTIVMLAGGVGVELNVVLRRELDELDGREELEELDMLDELFMVTEFCVVAVVEALDV